MKTKNLLRAIAAVSLLTFSCAKDIETEVTPIEQTNGVKTYTMTVVAGKGEVGTKALNLTDGTLNATWAENDVVTVYKSDTQIGTLTAQSSGQSTTLKGTLSGTINANDVLTLKFLDSNYATQDGTLDFIAANCDYATAEVTVSSTENDVITTTGNASFVNQQAIVEFTLKEKAETDIPISGGVTSLIVNAAGTEITVTPTAATNVLYVAIPAITDGAISLQAVDPNGVPRSYEKTAATFEKGKFYKIGVKMDCVVMNYTELKAAINSQVPKITLGADINISEDALFTIDNSTTIELNNHFIAGFKDEQTGEPANGIFYVNAGKTLTINGPGTLKDAYRDYGGAIYNKGTVSINDVSFSGNKVMTSQYSPGAGRGGAIYNSSEATATLTNVTFSGNTASSSFTLTGGQGGAIYNANNAIVSLNNVTFTGNSAKYGGGAICNYGTLNMSGKIVASDNTRSGDPDNVNLASGKVITLNGALTEGTSIGVTLSSNSETGIVFTSGYSTYNGTTDPNTFFSSDDAKQQISLKDDEVYLYNVNPALYVLNVPYLNQWEGEVVQTPTYIDVCAKLSSIQPQDIGEGNRVYLLEDYSKWYIVDKDLTINQRIEVLGEVNIILADNTKLTATNSIYVSSPKINGHTNTLHIWGQSTGQSMGLLTVTSAEENYAAIGGKGDRVSFGNDAGYLHFHGGEVQAVNHLTSNGAGIYGARVIGVEQYGTFIYGGKIFAVGGQDAPGIGSPFKYECGGIKITGGVVSAIGGECAAGIGTGHGGIMHRRANTSTGNPADDDATEIRITGGDITAIGTGGGAGIGGGQGTDIYEGDGARFIMTGGKVDAQTSEGSAGNNESLAIGRGHNIYNTYTIPPVIIGSPIIRATKDVNENPVPVVTDWPSNISYVHVIIEY